MPNDHPISDDTTDAATSASSRNTQLTDVTSSSSSGTNEPPKPMTINIYKLIMVAVRQGDIETLRLLCPDADDETCQDAMTLAIRLDDEAMVTFFARERDMANIQFTKTTDEYPINIAADGFHLVSLKCLLACGAIPQVSANFDSHTLHLLMQNLGNPACNGAYDKEVSEIVSQLIKAGAEVNLFDRIFFRTKTIIYSAIRQGYHRTVKCLLEAGAWVPDDYDFVYYVTPEVEACFQRIDNFLQCNMNIYLHHRGEKQGFLSNEGQRANASLCMSIKKIQSAPDINKEFLYITTQKQSKKIMELKKLCDKQTQQISDLYTRLNEQSQQIIALTRQQNRQKRQVEEITGDREEGFITKSHCSADRVQPPRSSSIKFFTPNDSGLVNASMQASSSSSTSSSMLPPVSSVSVLPLSKDKDNDDQPLSQTFNSDDESSDCHIDHLASPPSR